MKKFLLLFSIFAISLMGCKERSPQIISGREWNAGRNVIADTTSVFRHLDPFILQLDYGKNFDMDSLKCEIIDEKGKVRYSKTTRVSPKQGIYTLRGVKNGEVMTIGAYLKSKKSQSATIRFYAKENLIVEKQIQVVNEK